MIKNKLEFFWGTLFAVSMSFLALASCSDSGSTSESTVICYIGEPSMDAAGQGLDTLPLGESYGPVFAMSSSSDMRSPLGTNLMEPTYWSSQLPLVDIFKCSRVWLSGDATTWSNGNPVAVDSDGWVTSVAPGQIVRTQMLTSLPVTPSGRYVMTWDGEGTFQFSGGASEVAGQSTPGRTVVDVTGTVLLYITDTNPSNYMRNIRFVREMFESTSAVWDPEFIGSLADVSCLRFMDMCRTNGSSVQSWSERPMVSDSRYASEKGMPYELAVDLANTAGKDAWFCIPHLANDAFITSLADMIRDNLDPSLKCYIEYSNEVWNSQFEQAQWCEQQGLALGLSTNAFRARLYFQSQRSVEMFDLFEQSFGSTDRLVRVMASQAGNPWTAQQLLSHNGASSSCDAMSIAPYFGPNITDSNLSTFLGMTADDMMDYIEQVSMSLSIGRMHSNHDVAMSYGLPMIAYEGGQHITGNVSQPNRDAITQLMIDANRSVRMEKVYKKYLSSWRMSGGELFVHYNHIGGYSQWGCWGSFEWQGQPISTAPKAKALQAFVEENQRWW